MQGHLNGNKTSIVHTCGLIDVDVNLIRGDGMG
jgi:hypothetical protein